jgi:hypothetical protein
MTILSAHHKQAKGNRLETWNKSKISSQGKIKTIDFGLLADKESLTVI